MRSSERGFTLIEMLIVIAIIVLLTAMILPSIRDILEQTRVTTAKGDCRTLLAALESYGIYNRGFYPKGPDESEGLDLLIDQVPRIVNRVPEDPFGLSDGDFYKYATDYEYHPGDDDTMQRAYYWVCWSIGPRGSCRAGFLDGDGFLVVNDSGEDQEGITGPEPGVKTIDQIAYSTNASLIHLYSINETAVLGETP